MPSPFFAVIQPRTAASTLLGLALMVSGMALSGCGNNNSTTRTTSDDREVTPVSDNVQLTLQSPVRLINLEARIIDPLSGRVLHQSVITDSDQLVVDLSRKNLPTRGLLYAELRPSSTRQSRYYDPVLDTLTTFDAPLRAVVQNSGSSQNILIDPYTDIIFQRAQVRSGWLSSRTDIAQLGLITENALNAAASEVAAVFTVRSTTLPEGIDRRTALQAFTISTNRSNILDYFRFSIGHIQHYVIRQGAVTSPYLAFAQAAAQDMLDGDLDGMTLYGFGDQSPVLLEDPLVPPILNNIPDRNQHALLAIDQRTARETYNNAVGDAIKGFFNPLFISTSAEFQRINQYDYINMTTRQSANTPRLFGLHSPGAGNYTRAFGLSGNQLIKNFLNADDTGLVSDIEQLAGIYQNSQGCRLEIRPNGRVILSQGGQRFESDIDRNLNDSMSRTTPDSQAYLLNITTPSESTPSFLQIQTQGADVLFAQYGRSLLENPSTTQLSTVDLSCNF